MGILLFLLLIGIPIAELMLIVTVARHVGVLETFGLLIVISIAGAWLLKQQGMATWARLQDTLARGEMPTQEVTDGALIMLGGALLLTPGFLTDIVGLLFLLPPTRALIKGTARRVMGRWARGRAPVRAGTYTARVIRTQRREPPATPSSPPPSPPISLPTETHPPSSDDSPDRG